MMSAGDLKSCFDRQRAAYHQNPQPSRALRLADLDALTRLLRDNRDAIVEAINLDFGSRSSFETLFLEFYVAQSGIRAATRQLRGWMKPQRRRKSAAILSPGASNHVVPQPVGVVGVIVPWNFPLLLSVSPLVSIFAAGNHAMVKMSENSGHLAALLAALSSKYLPAEKLQFFADQDGLGPAFASLAFDHLLFTGSGATGRAVMTSAARNLTPVTLELGGKSPAIVGPDYPVKTAAERILWGKMLNAGQICTAIDYAFVLTGAVAEFAEHCRRLFAERYPDINSPDYTSIIDERAFRRLTDTEIGRAHV